MKRLSSRSSAAAPSPVSQVTQLESQSRDAYRKQEYAQAEALMRQADALRAELAQEIRRALRA